MGTDALTQPIFLTPSDNTVSVMLPASWTAAGGNASIRLNATILDAQSEEEQIVYSVGAKLFFDARDEGDPISADESGGLSSLIDKASEVSMQQTTQLRTRRFPPLPPMGRQGGQMQRRSRRKKLRRRYRASSTAAS